MSCSFPKAFYIALSDERPSIDCLSLFRLRVSSSYLVRSDYMSSRSSSLKVLLFAVVVHAALACNSPKIKQHSPTTEIMISTFSLPIIRRYFYFKKKKKKKKKKLRSSHQLQIRKIRKKIKEMLVKNQPFR